jgi:hypothetical protein
MFASGRRFSGAEFCVLLLFTEFTCNDFKMMVQRKAAQTARAASSVAGCQRWATESP